MPQSLVNSLHISQAALLALQLLTSAIVTIQLPAQTVSSCDMAAVDSARAAYSQGDDATAILRAELSSENCFSGALVLYDAYRRAGIIGEFRKFARPRADAGDVPLAYFLGSDLSGHLFISSTSSANLADAVRFLELAHHGGLRLATLALAEYYYLGRFHRDDETLPRIDFNRALEYFRACQGPDRIGRECSEGAGLALLRIGRTQEGLALLKASNALEALWAIFRFGFLRIPVDGSKADSLERAIRVFSGDPNDWNVARTRFLRDDLRRY